MKNPLTQEAASAAAQMSAATEQLSGMTQELQGMMGQFQVGDSSRPAEVPQGTEIAAQESEQQGPPQDRSLPA